MSRISTHHIWFTSKYHLIFDDRIWCSFSLTYFVYKDVVWCRAMSTKKANIYVDYFWFSFCWFVDYISILMKILTNVYKIFHSNWNKCMTCVYAYDVFPTYLSNRLWIVRGMLDIYLIDDFNELLYFSFFRFCCWCTFS